MKISTLLITLAISTSFAFSAESDSTGMAGDGLDLTAVMELFKDSETVEEFENNLNSEKNEVNNLDLNNDGHVDYIRVIERAEGDAHSLTLQVPYSDKEDQDVAVIEIEKNGDETFAQIVGDEELYGEDYIVEPGTEDNNQVSNVSSWKPVRHIYSPRYVVWVSPWRFGYYPRWYRPWRPVSWHIYNGRHRRHHVRYRRSRIYRCPRAHGHYHKHKVHSVTFHKHHHVVHHKGVKTVTKTKTTNGKANQTKQVNKKTSSGKTVKKTAAPKTSTQTKSSSSKPTKRPGARKTQVNGGKKKSPNNKAKSSGPGFKSSNSKPTKRPGASRGPSGGGKKSQGSRNNSRGGGRH